MRVEDPLCPQKGHFLRSLPTAQHLVALFHRSLPPVMGRTMWDMSRESQGLGLKLELLKFRMLFSTTNISNMTNLYNAQCT